MGMHVRKRAPAGLLRAFALTFICLAGSTAFGQANREQAPEPVLSGEEPLF